MNGFEPKFNITNRMTAAITQIERARGFLEAAKLSDDWVRDMGATALLKEAHHTTHIEGTLLTLDQAERTLTTLSKRSTGHIVVLNRSWT